jgi:cysteine synthase
VRVPLVARFQWPRTFNISSGANVAAAIRLAVDLGPRACVVTVLPDSNNKYLSTDLWHEEPPREEYITPRVSLEGFRAVR